MRVCVRVSGAYLSSAPPALDFFVLLRRQYVPTREGEEKDGSEFEGEGEGWSESEGESEGKVEDTGTDEDEGEGVKGEGEREGEGWNVSEG